MKSFLQELSKIDEKLLSLLTENLPDMLWIKDIDGYYIYANKAICDGLLMAKDIKEPIGRNDVFFAKRERELHKDNPTWHTFGELCFNSDQVVIEANKPMKFEEWGNVKGKLLYLEVNKAPVHDKEGNIIGTVGSGRDITELKLTQIELAKQAQIIEDIHECIITSDLNGNILTWNKSSKKLFGYSAEEIKNKNINLIFQEKEFDKIKKINLKSLEENTVNEKINCITKDSTKLICEVSLSLIKEKDNNKIVYYLKDITEKTALSEEIKQKEQIIHIQSQHVAMGQMIGNIAHQWRQPLCVISAISTGLELQKSLGTLSENILDSSLKDIDKQVQYLSNTIDTFRDYIIEEKVYKEVVLQERINKSLEIIQPSLSSNYIKLINEIDYSNPLKLKLTIGELSQVIINIINNAKDILLEKQVNSPWIKISLQKNDNFVLISIEDNGGGVPKEIINLIFDPYFTTKHKSKGTGLGLYMSYKIVVESLKGELFVVNTENGAKFFIKIPL